jgi:excisionase family DNA binding protein
MLTQELYSIHEASKVLGCSEPSLRSRIARKEIPVVRVGRSVRIARAAIEAILRGQLVK